MRGQIYINSIRSKFDYLLKGVRGNIDILMISEAKIEASFPATQFLINGYTSPCRLNRKGRGGGILSLCLREHTVITNYSQSSKYRRFFLETNLRKKKWVISCSCNSQNQTIFSHMQSMVKAIDSLSSKHEIFLMIGD